MSYLGKISHFLMLFLSIITLVSCGSDSQDNETTDPESDLIKGWQEYNSGNCESAIVAFEKVINDNTSLTIAGDAYNGLGWSYLNMSKSVGVNQVNITNALGKFDEAIKHDNTNSDAWIGQACAFLVRRDNSKDFQSALESIDNSLQGDSKYLYRHDYISEADVHALKVQCYYYLGEFVDAQREIEYTLSIKKDNNVALTVKDLLGN